MSPKTEETYYKDVFEKPESFPGIHKIQLNPDIERVIYPPRKIPIALRDKLERESKRLGQLNRNSVKAMHRSFSSMFRSKRLEPCC